ncbi:hypothetical protein SMC26_04930 [Actinomadura fulvescens]|uniref:Uncharacterized protein n=1 Tax=Actinomadura fulvescens TaxID=46160 RepID=A0ABN3PR41_9ACTN
MLTAPISRNDPAQCPPDGTPRVPAVSLTKAPDDLANRDTRATRHLCAATYLDRAFRTIVLRQIYGDPYRRVAPSYGFDLVPVVAHAWRSWALASLQQVAVLLVVLVGCAIRPATVVTMLCWLGIFFALRTFVRAVPDVFRLKLRQWADRLLQRIWRDRRRIEEDEHLRRQFWVVRIGFWTSLVLLVASQVAAGWAGTSPSTGSQAAAALLIPIALAVMATAAVRQVSLNGLHHASELRRADLTRREAVIDRQQSYPVVVYHRPAPEKADEKWAEFDPFEREPTIFVGSGQLVHRWLPPLVIQLMRPGEEGMSEREYERPPFRTHQLVDHLRNAMRRVSTPEDPRRLKLLVQDRVFINERDVSAEPDLLSERPGRARLRQIIDDPHHVAHHFLQLQVTTDGELVTTVFLRAGVRGRSLSLDFAACALTRTPPGYHDIDLYGESGAGAVVRAVLRALWRLPEETAQVVWLCQAPFILKGVALAGKDRTLVPRRRILVGSRVSVREHASLSWKDSRFDETRVHDDIKLVEQRLLKATEDFLDQHKIDTSTFKKKASNIINNSGVLNMGGRLEMSQTSVGAGAQTQIQVQAQAKAGGTDKGDG